jgi:hypothetical protein
MVAPCLSALESIRSEFVEILPGLAGRLSVRFRFRDPDAQADAVAEAIGIAWMMFLAARTRGKHPSAGNLAFYAGKAVDAGRKVTGTSSLDALSDTSLSRTRQGHALSLEEVGETGRFYRTFGDRRWRWPVIDYVQPHLDMEAFQAGCSHRDRQIMKMKERGLEQREIAGKLGISPPAVCQRLSKLRRLWEAMGAV